MSLKFSLKLEQYIFHPRQYYNISNQDAGDIVGDTYFVCEDVLLNNTAKDHYEVSMFM